MTRERQEKIKHTIKLPKGNRCEGVFARKELPLTGLLTTVRVAECVVRLVIP